MIHVALALLLDRVFPVHWARPEDADSPRPCALTSDPADADDRYARWLANARLDANRATEVRPCPAFVRLDEVMSGSGKVSADPPSPALFGMGWWA